MFDFRFSLVFLLLACTLQAQGDFLEKAVREIQVLAEKVDEKIEQLAHTPEATKLMVTNKYQDLKVQNENEVNHKVEEAVKKVQTMRCSPDAVVELRSLSGLIGNRFANCINFTQGIISLEVFIYNLGTQMGTVEDLVCMGIQNATHCTKSGTILEKIACVSRESMETIQDLKTQSASIIAAYNQLKEIGEGMVNNFLKCFTNSKLAIDTMINKAIEKHCTT